jgi:hypothetical protein
VSFSAEVFSFGSRKSAVFCVSIVISLLGTARLPASCYKTNWPTSDRGENTHITR